MEDRLQKILSASGFCSRREAEEIIAAGRVRVNGRPCKLGDKADISKDIISLDGVIIDTSVIKDKVYIMLNKPRGYVTTTSDELERKDNASERPYLQNIQSDRSAVRQRGAVDAACKGRRFGRRQDSPGDGLRFIGGRGQGSPATHH